MCVNGILFGISAIIFAQLLTFYQNQLIGSKNPKYPNENNWKNQF
jgi:hypothetical protein